MYLPAWNVSTMYMYQNPLRFLLLALLWRRFLSCRNQSIDLQSTSIDWFLCDMDLHHENKCVWTNVLFTGMSFFWYIQDLIIGFRTFRIFLGRLFSIFVWQRVEMVLLRWQKRLYLYQINCLAIVLFPNVFVSYHDTSNMFNERKQNI